MNTLGLEGAWNFSYNDNFEEEPIKVNLSQRDNKVIFTVPWGVKGIDIELTSFDREKNTLKGKYTMKDVSSSDEVTFRITAAGKHLEGIPRGFAVRKIWNMQKIDNSESVKFSV